MPNRNLIGPRVREARYRHQPKLTQAELAARMQVAGFSLDRAAIAKIEGRYREVTDIELVALADALGVSVAWLVNASDTEPPSLKSGLNPRDGDSVRLSGYRD